MRGLLLALTIACRVVPSGPPELPVAASPPPAEDPDGDGWGPETDCGPDDASMHPGAFDPPCDGVDSDCDGDAVDAVSCTASLATADGRWVAPAGAGLAYEGLAARYLDGGLDHLAILDAGAVVTSEQLGPEGKGTIWLLAGDGSGSGDPTDGDVMAYSATTSIFGMVGGADADGDGLRDLWAVANTRAGNLSAYLLSGGSTNLLVSEDEPLVQIASADQFWSAADFDGDGQGDLLAHVGISATASVFLGGDWSTPAVTIDSGWATGWTVADLDGDGFSEAVGTDVLLQAIVSAPLDGAGLVAPEAIVSTGPDPHRLRGGDFDGDGHADLAVQTAWDAVRVVRGPIVPGADALAAPDSIAVEALQSIEVGDVDCDGRDDLVFAWDDGFLRRVSVHAEVAAGAVHAAELGGWHGEYPGDDAGDDLVTGDLDGDGCADVVVTAPSYGNFGTEDAGAAYVLLGLP